MRNVLVIWRKEMKDTIRDRRTLTVMVIVPIFLMPLLFILIGQIGKSAGTEVYTVAVSGETHAPSLVAALREDTRLTIRSSADPAAAVRDQHAAVGLVIPAGFEAAIAAGRPAPLKVIENSTRSSSSSGSQELDAAMATYTRRVVLGRLQRHGLGAAVLAPLATRQEDVATKQEQGGFLLSFILPLFIVIYAITGGMYTAMDVSAGEKERSTLEALLLTPATRMQITLGKLLAVSTVGFLSIVLAMSSMVVTLTRFPISTDRNGNADLAVSLDPRVVPLIFALGILMALAFSALELALGILARSFKEAQSYITPLYLASFLPVVIVNSIPGFQPPAAIFLVPAVNAVLLFKEALLGQATASHAILTILSLLAFAALAAAVTVNMFTREKVLLKT